ncbi:MAG: hypothetical protein KDI37_10450 [Xanthomonadales bacterium]|nr:hypothetical protein [Xanthomonadales bacterium]
MSHGQYPKIDSPCPLRLRQAPQPGRDLCTHCQQRVHRLDLLDEAQRRALLANSQAPICVAYAVPRSPQRLARAAAGVGLAVAMGVAGSAAFAADGFDPSARPDQVLQLTPSADSGPDCDDADEDYEQHVVVLGGGVTSPGEATWVDTEDLALPQVPQASDAAFLDEVEFVSATVPAPRR